jgi:hypothetical protein
MLPLIRMTWTLNRRLLFQFSPLFAMYLAQLVALQCGPEPAVFIFMFLAIATLTTAIVTLQGLTLPVEGFLLSLPVSRAQVVRAKYVTSLLGLAAGLALPLVTAWTAHGVAPTRVPALGPDSLGIVPLAGLLLALGLFYFLPFVYHFGPTKGLLFFALTLILLPAGALAWKGAHGCLEALLAFGNHILDHSPSTLAFSAGVLLFDFASLRLSIWAYRRRAL